MTEQTLQPIIKMLTEEVARQTEETINTALQEFSVSRSDCRVTIRGKRSHLVHGDTVLAAWDAMPTPIYGPETKSISISINPVIGPEEF